MIIKFGIIKIFLLKIRSLNDVIKLHFKSLQVLSNDKQKLLLNALKQHDKKKCDKTTNLIY